MFVQCPRGPVEGIESPRTGVTDNEPPPCGCRDLNPNPLEEQPMHLAAEPSLWTLIPFPLLLFQYQWLASLSSLLHQLSSLGCTFPFPNGA